MCDTKKTNVNTGDVYYVPNEGQCNRDTARELDLCGNAVYIVQSILALGSLLAINM